MKRTILAIGSMVCCLAAMAQEKVEVKFDLNYQTQEQVAPVTVTKGRMMKSDEKPLPVREGFRFGGWYTSPECQPDQEWLFGNNSVGFYTSPTDSMAVDKGMTLFAKWVAPKPIRTAEDLDSMRNDLYGWYVLENDIDMSGIDNWVPVGEYEGPYEFADGEWWKKAFKGVLDGRGHTIKGLKITNLLTAKSGLFGAVANGEIHDLNMDGTVIEMVADNPYIAPLAGILKQDDRHVAAIRNCRITNTLIKVRTNNEDPVFHSFTGLCGGAWGGTIADNYAGGRMDIEIGGKGGGELYVGAFLGEAYNDTERCESDFDINIRFSTPAAGGLKAFIGGLQASATNVNNCNSKGTISVSGNPGSEEIYISGLVGSERYGTVASSGSSVTVKTADMPAAQVGGIVGEFNQGYGVIGAAFGTTTTAVRGCTFTGKATFDNVDKPVYGEISGAGVPEALSSPWGLSMKYVIE